MNYTVEIAVLNNIMIVSIKPDVGSQMSHCVRYSELTVWAVMHLHAVYQLHRRYSQTNTFTMPIRCDIAAMATRSLYCDC